jgi:tryptophanyl-tRNA synthetase
MLNTKERHAKIEVDCKSAAIGCVECKGELAGKMLDWLRPIQERRKALLAEPGKLDAIIARGTERAREVARHTMKEVREAVFGSR